MIEKIEKLIFNYRWNIGRELESAKIPIGTINADKMKPKEKFSTLTIAKAVPVSSNTAICKICYRMKDQLRIFKKIN